MNDLQTGTGMVPAAFAYAYDPVGSLTNMTVSLDNAPALSRQYQTDAAGRLVSLTQSGTGVPPVVFGYTYAPENGLVSRVENLDTGIAAAYAFDIMDRITDIAWQADGSNTLRGFAMDYDNADMITNVVHATGERRVYTYDSIDRLIGEEHMTASDTLLYSAAYEYDLAGNRTQTVINGVTNTYTLGLGNRLAAWGVNAENAQTYDSAGNVTQITDASGTRSLSWDIQYRLTQVAVDGAPVETYGYDPLGRRSWTSDGSVTNWHIHDGMHIVADTDAQGNLLRSYTWGPGIDNLLAMTVYPGGTGSTPSVYFAITDHLGTVHALADDTGAIVESYRFDAWGNILAVYDASGSPLTSDLGHPTSALGNRYLFQGREYSWATGLYNFRARWYDPITGRWLSNDPIGISGGLNQYVAFGNNPVMFVDPLGEAWSWGTAAIGAGLNVAGYAIGSWLIGEKVTAGGFAGAATSGFVAGAIVGAFSGDVSALGAAVIGGAAGGIGALGGSVVQQSIDNRSISGRQVVRDTALGTLGGSLGGYFTPASSVARSAAVGLGVGTGLTIGDKTVTKIENAADSFKNLIENSDSRRFEKVCP